MQDFILSDSEDQNFRDKIMIDDNNDDKESDELVDIFTKKINKYFCNAQIFE